MTKTGGQLLAEAVRAHRLFLEAEQPLLDLIGEVRANAGAKEASAGTRAVLQDLIWKATDATKNDPLETNKTAYFETLWQNFIDRVQAAVIPGIPRPRHLKVDADAKWDLFETDDGWVVTVFQSRPPFTRRFQTEQRVQRYIKLIGLKEENKIKIP